MGFQQRLPVRYIPAAILLCGLVLLWPPLSTAKDLNNAEIAREIRKQSNEVIIDEFLKYELRDVNKNVTNHLIKAHPSLEFFVKQVDRGPLKSLFFLEEWLGRLRDAQAAIDSFPYNVTFSSDEKKKIMGLKPVADKIASYGIPVMKRDFYKVAAAAKVLANQKKKHPMELIPDLEFRNAIYRHIDPTAKGLDEAMGDLSNGELVCMRLGWVLEQVTITRVWLTVTDNWLPSPNDYMPYRKKRSEYFEKRLKQIYGSSNTR